MSITCKDLLTLPSFKNITLIGGEKGLNRTLTWPYVGQTANVSEWIHGGELLFLTGIGLDNTYSTLNDLVNECVAKHLCGMVILIGSDYIKEIPEFLIDLAEKYKFPLFKMPWNIKLIDVTKEIVELIMIDKQTKEKSKNFLNRLILAEAGEQASIDDLASTYHIPLNPYRFMSIFHIEGINNSPEEFLRIDFLQESFQQSIISLCKQKNIPLITTISGNNILCFISSNSVKEAEDSMIYLESCYNLLMKIYSSEKIYLGIGRVYPEEEPLTTSYHEAKKAQELCKKIRSDKNIMRYQDLGIFKLFLNVQNKNELRNYYNYKLEPLIKYDTQNQSDLLGTLKAYLENDCNLVNTARALFIHRNTLIYRLNKIKELLSSDFDVASEKLELYNCIMAKVFLNE